MGMPQGTIENKVFVRTIETPRGKINVYRKNEVDSEEVIQQQKEEFYAFLVRLILQ